MINSCLELSTLYIHYRENQVNIKSNMYWSKFKTINSIDILELLKLYQLLIKKWVLNNTLFY